MWSKTNEHSAGPTARVSLSQFYLDVLTVLIERLWLRTIRAKSIPESIIMLNRLKFMTQ